MTSTSRQPHALQRRRAAAMIPGALALDSAAPVKRAAGAYVIDGGHAGKARSSVLSQVLEPTTDALFDRVGVVPGMACLDAGCGGGDVTRMLARRVGARGCVLGVDFDADIVRLAQADARADGLDQASFRVADVTRLQLDVERDLRSNDRPRAGFDRVYARFVLTHLADPPQAIRALIDMLAPGGVLIVEDVEMKGRFCHPAYPPFEAAAQLYRDASSGHGGDPEIGPKLPGLFDAAGLRDVGVHLVQPVFRSGEGKTIMSLTLRRIRTAMLAEGAIAATAFDDLVERVAAYEARPDTLVSLPRIFQVWGTRALVRGTRA